MSDYIDTVFGQGGLFAKALPGYRPRPGQITLAKALDAVMGKGGQLLGEAGCGVGKSLAYLTPAAHHARQSGLHTVIATATIALQDQLEKKDLPWLKSHLGTPFTYAVLKGKQNYLCLGGETQVLTRNGVRKIADLAGGVHELLDGTGHWVSAPVKCYGEARLRTITLAGDGGTQISVRATDDHRWFVKTGGRDSSTFVERTTAELLPGDRLVRVHPTPVAKRCRPSPFGIAHGIAFGDGTLFASTANGWRAGTVVLHGEKRELLCYFPLNFTQAVPLTEQGYSQDAVRVFDVPVGFKSFPPLTESASYLLGWLAGYFATDGSVYGGRSVSLSSSQWKNLDFARTVAARLGIVTGEIHERMRVGIGQTDSSALYRLYFRLETLGDDFFLRSKHSTNVVRSSYLRPRRLSWIVKSVGPASEHAEPVYCAEVPTTHSFVLNGYLLTGNCTAKFNSFVTQYQHVVRPADRMQAKEVIAWGNGTETGDRSELAFNPDFWPEVSSTSDECRGRRCPAYADCWARRAKVRASKADIVVVNYHLLLVAGGMAVPEHRVLICDEAHELADTARQVLGWTIKRSSFERFARWARSCDDDPPAGRDDQIEDAFKQHGISQPHVFAGELRKAAVDLFSILDAVRRGRGEKMRIEQVGEFTNFVIDRPCKLLQKIGRVAGTLASEWHRDLEKWYDDDLAGAMDDAERIADASAEMISRLQLLVDPRAEPNTVVWLQENGRGEVGRQSWLSIEGRALDVSGPLRMRLSTLHASALVSATLAVGTDFSFVRGEVGALPSATELIVPSPFNFAKQAVCIIPERIAVPPRKYDFETSEEFDDAEHAWRTAVSNHALALIKLCGGRCLLLFSSRAAMNFCHGLLQEQLSWHVQGVNVLKQGDAPTPELLRRFKEDKHSVLLGVASLWQGVDVPGDALVGVLIDRMPFPVPSEPLEAALGDMLKAQGKSPFVDRSVPTATIALRQGFGRLIRSETDIGVVVLTDTRLIHPEVARYGKHVLAALPNAPKARTFQSAYKVAPLVFKRIAALPRPTGIDTAAQANDTGQDGETTVESQV